MKTSSTRGPATNPEPPSRFQRVDWRIQKGALAAFGLVIVVAMLGVFGDGIASAVTRSENGVAVRYERFARFRFETEMVIRVDDGARTDPIKVELTGWLVGRGKAMSMTPRPSLEEAIPGGCRYVFEREGNRSVEIFLQISPEESGRYEGELRVGISTIHLSTFVYP
jgi:hypothetical protein